MGFQFEHRNCGQCYRTFWEKLCQNQSLGPEACGISKQQVMHMLLVRLNSKKNHICHHQNLHLDHIDFVLVV
jgi:hypothetical protein